MVQNLTTTNATSSSITLEWNELSCVDRNGELTGYRIEYGNTTFDMAATQTSFTATGLIPFTNYTFRVAALNKPIPGTVNSTISTRTLLPSGSCS